MPYFFLCKRGFYSKQKETFLEFLEYLKKENYSFFFYPVNRKFRKLNEKEEIENILQQKFEGSFYDSTNDVYVNMLYFEKKY